MSAIELTGILKKMQVLSRMFLLASGRIMKVRDQSKIFYIRYVFPICTTSDNMYDLDYIVLHSSWKVLAYYI